MTTATKPKRATCEHGLYLGVPCAYCETPADLDELPPLYAADRDRTGSAWAKQHLNQRLVEPGFGWDWTEYNLRHGRQSYKKDLFGFGDAIFCEPGKGATILQITEGAGNASARYTKMMTERLPAVAAWLGSGNKVEIWDYRKRIRGGKVVAIARVVRKVTMADVAEAEGGVG